MPGKDQYPKREVLKEKANLLKNQKIINDNTYDLLTADRRSLSRLIELRDSDKMKKNPKNFLSDIVSRLEAFSGVTWDELDKKMTPESLPVVLDDYIDQCLKKLDEKLILAQKREALQEKAKLLKDQNLINDGIYNLLTADRKSLSRLIELRDTNKIRKNNISIVAKDLEKFSGVTWDELDKKMTPESLPAVLDDYIDQCLKKADEKLLFAKKREELKEKAKLLKDQNLINDRTYNLLTADRMSLSRLIELRDTDKMKKPMISAVASKLETFSGVTWAELNNKLKTEPLTAVLDDYIDQCLKKADEKLNLVEKKQEEPVKKEPVKKEPEPVAERKLIRDIPRLDPKMTWEESAETKKKMTALKKQVFEDYKQQLQNKEGHARVKHVLNYAVFNMVEGLGEIPEYDLMQDFLTPIGPDAKIDFDEARKRMRDVAAFLHEEINKPFVEYARKHPNHSDDWYQEHFIAETDAGKYWRILDSSLTNTVAGDLVNAMEAANARYTKNDSIPPSYGQGQGKARILEIFEEEKEKYLKGLDSKEELHYNDFATRAIKPIKFEMSEMMHDPRTRKIYKNQQKKLKAQEALENNNLDETQTAKWMKFAQGLETSFISNKDLKIDYIKMVFIGTKDFQDMLVENGIEDQDTNNLAADEKNKDKASKSVALNPEDAVAFSGKETADILKSFEEVKDVKIGEFNGYAADKDEVKSEDEKKLDAFVENLLDLKANAKLEREIDNQKLYDSVVEELKKEQNATALHTYLRKCTMEALAGANGNLKVTGLDRDLDNNFYDPSINKAIEYYNLYIDVTGSDLREKYRKEAGNELNDKAEDAMKVLIDKSGMTPFGKTLLALNKAKTGKKDPIEKELLDKNKKLFNSSLLAPYVKGAKLLNNQIEKRNNDLAMKIKQQEIAVKNAQDTVDKVKNNLYFAAQNLKITVGDLRSASSSNNSQTYIDMVQAIETLRPNIYGSFYTRMSNTDPEKLSAEIANVTQKIDDYINYAENKKWYHMLPYSTGRTRYQEALEAKEILERIPNYRKQLEKATKNLDKLKNEEKKIKKDKEINSKVRLNKSEIDQLLKPKSKEAPVKSSSVKMPKKLERSKTSPAMNLN